MTEITLKLETSKKYLSYLQLMNGILKLSDKQIKILAAFLNLGNGGSLCSREDRKQVEYTFDIQNVNTYVKFFKDRNLIIPSEHKKGLYKPSILITPPTDGVVINTKWI